MLSQPDIVLDRDPQPRNLRLGVHSLGSARVAATHRVRNSRITVDHAAVTGRPSQAGRGPHDRLRPSSRALTCFQALACLNSCDESARVDGRREVGLAERAG